MTDVATAQECRVHAWERREEERGGVDCVVRYCPRCGRTEVCWSRRTARLAGMARGETRTEFAETQ
jgi:hypothetical protein